MANWFDERERDRLVAAPEWRTTWADRFKIVGSDAAADDSTWASRLPQHPNDPLFPWATVRAVIDSFAWL